MIAFIVFCVSLIIRDAKAVLRRKLAYRKARALFEEEYEEPKVSKIAEEDAAGDAGAVASALPPLIKARPSSPAEAPSHDADHLEVLSQGEEMDQETTGEEAQKPVKVKDAALTSKDAEIEEAQRLVQEKDAALTSKDAEIEEAQRLV